MPVKAKSGGQGRVRSGRVGAQVGSGSSPASPGGNSAEVTQFFSRLATQPSTARASLYSALIDGLVSDGVWSSLDALYMIAAADQATGLTNLIQSAFGASLDGSPTFTSDVGISNCGAIGVKDLNTNFTPSTAGGHYTQNSAMFAGWEIGTVSEARALINNFNNSGAVELFPEWTDGKTYWAINEGGTESSFTNPADISGFWLVQRTGAGAAEILRNDVSLATSTSASAALSASPICSGPVANSVAALAIGSALGSTPRSALYGRIQTYLHGVGAV